MKKNFTKLVAVVLITILSLGVVASAQFPDVPSDHWAYDAVTKLVDEGLLTGMPDGNFHGNEPMNRYAVAVLVSRLMDKMAEQPATVVERIVQQPVTVNQPVQPIVEKTIVERVVQEPVEVTKIVEKEYVEVPVETVIEKHIVHELSGLTEDEVNALIAEYLKEKDAIDAETFRYTSNKLYKLESNMKNLEAKTTDLEKQLEEINAKLAEDSTSTKSINEMRDQLQAQSDKMVEMEKQVKSAKTIAILGLLAGIAGIVLAFVIK